MVIWMPPWLAMTALLAGPVIALAIIVSLAVRDVRRRREEEEDWATSDQIVGRACVLCALPIRNIVDGGLCKRCEEPLHRSCHREHRSQAHPRGVYR
jgi:hypothetical protein